MGVGVKTSHHG